MTELFKTTTSNDQNKSIYDLVIHPLMYDPKPFLDNHYINKIYELGNEHYSKIYNYHLDYYLTNQVSGNKEKYLHKIREVIMSAKHELLSESRKTISVNRKNILNNKIQHLDDFINALKKYDNWGIIDTESERNRKLSAENQLLKKKLADITIKPQYKIDIRNGNKRNLIALFQDLISIEHPQGSSNVTISTAANKTWAKLLSVYFSENGNEISLETALNYFDGTSKLTENDRIYEISYIKR